MKKILLIFVFVTCSFSEEYKLGFFSLKTTSSGVRKAPIKVPPVVEWALMYSAGQINSFSSMVAPSGFYYILFRNDGVKLQIYHKAQIENDPDSLYLNSSIIFIKKSLSGKYQMDTYTYIINKIFRELDIFIPGENSKKKSPEILGEEEKEERRRKQDVVIEIMNETITVHTPYQDWGFYEKLKNKKSFKEKVLKALNK